MEQVSRQIYKEADSKLAYAKKWSKEIFNSGNSIFMCKKASTFFYGKSVLVQQEYKTFEQWILNTNG